jgi:cytochrome c biogenesis factor
MTEAPSGRMLNAARVMAIAGAIIVAAGTVLPWRNDVAGLETSGVSLGFDADVFLLVAILTAVACGASLLRGSIPQGPADLVVKYIGSGAGLALLGGGGIACFSLLNIKDTPIGSSTGVGLYLDLIGGLLMIVGGVVALLRGERQ